MRSLPAWSLAAMTLFACTPSAPGLGAVSQALNGAPQNGYPNYAERLMLVTINRARSDPNNHALGTAGSTKCPSACATNGTKSPTCWDTYPAQKPWMYSYAASRASRFHCQNLHQMHFGLSHPSPCTLRTDVDTTTCDGSQACACSANPHPNDCGSSTTPPWQGGTTPYVRVGYFGFTPNSYGEVGAAGYTDGWTAVAG